MTTHSLTGTFDKLGSQNQFSQNHLGRGLFYRDVKRAGFGICPAKSLNYNFQGRSKPSFGGT